MTISIQTRLEFLTNKSFNILHADVKIIIIIILIYNTINYNTIQLQNNVKTKHDLV